MIASRSESAVSHRAGRGRGRTTLLRSPPRQRGVALLVALLVLATASGLATGMIVQNQQAIGNTTRAFQGAQADRLAEGAIALARASLSADPREVDSPSDDWARPIDDQPVEGGTISLRVIDLQGRFNLNNLVDPEGKVDPVARKRLRALLEELGIPAGRVDAIADWIDDDQMPTGAGAEDGRYLGRTPPYRSADRPMRSVSELLAIGGFTAEEYSRLAPHVAALPPGTALNLNSATEVVMRALAGQGVAASETGSPAGSISEALARPPWVGAGLDSTRLAVASRYFLCSVTVRLGEITRQRFAVIERDDDGLTRTLAMSDRPCLNGHYCI